ncbi:MAG: amidohydrolase family protein [Acidimicrobiia bacterium]|nr:amidohydrolase family protein [Acidimicrobiia bacterium]
MIIDAHAHAIPPRFIDYLVSRGDSTAGNGTAGTTGLSTAESQRGLKVVFGDRTTAPLNPALSDMDARVAWMDRVGIDVQVLAGWIDLTGYEIDPANAIDYCRAHNECLADYAAPHHERFRLIGNIPLQAPPLAAQELTAMMESGFIGVEIATTVKGVALDQAGLDPVWEAAEATGAFVLLHPMTPLPGVDLDRYFLDNAVGRPAETSITLAGLILNGVFERFPGLKLCAVHGGGFVPYQIGRLDQAVKAKPDLAGANLTRLPSEYLRQIYVDTVVNEPAVLRFIVDYLGADRVLLGTDYPFPMGDLDPVATVRAMPGVTDEEFGAICGHNMDRLSSGRG